ncbi:MAG: acyl-CoA dehydrogenase family protein [Sphingobium sp.]
MTGVQVATGEGRPGADAVTLADMVRQWAARESPVAAFRARRDAGVSAVVDRASLAALADLGWTGIAVPEAHGGSGLGFEAAGMTLLELGRNLTISPLASIACAAWAIDRGGSPAQRDRWLPPIAAGGTSAALAVAQAPGQLDDGEIVATRQADGWRLDGTRRFVADGDGAGLFLISADCGEDSALFLVPGMTDGLVVRSRAMLDSLSHADIVLEGVALPDEAKLGGADLVDALRDRACVLASAEMLGIAEEGFARTLDYLKTRVQFGEPIGNFQALQHRAVALFEAVEMLRPVVVAALKAMDGTEPPDGDMARLRASLAKAAAGDTLHLLGREMIQMHGGIGMTDEHDAGLFAKRGAVLEAMWGNAAFHRDRFATLRGY